MGVDLDVTARATWNASVETDISYDSDDVRQGDSLAVTRTAPNALGSLSVVWSVSGTLNIGGLFGNPTIGPIAVSADSVSCVPQFAGGDYDCTGTSGSVPLFDKPPFAPAPLHPYVDLALRVTFTVTPEGAIVRRTLSIGDAPALGPGDLSLTGSALSEVITVPCDRAVGDDVVYDLDQYTWSPTTHASQQPIMKFGVYDPIFGLIRSPALFDAPFGPAAESDPSFELAGAGHKAPLGELLANNSVPRIAPFPLFTGREGAPVAFSATVNSRCPISSFVWDFSNGTQSFGPTPSRRFGDDGRYDGMLSATDSTGLRSQQFFAVDITNASPIVEAGPNTSGFWGVPIAFNGQAADPGWEDQPTLFYSWDWGDGTPGTGGASAFHTYNSPGNYLATLTVCDDTGCVQDTTAVVVRRRTTRLGYTGPLTGVFSTSVVLEGFLADELGNPLGGQNVSFSLGGQPGGAVQTSVFGRASREMIINVPAGVQPAVLSFAGTALYEPTVTSVAFEVTRMATVLTYTGDTSEHRNDKAKLRARLVDALGRPLSGKVIHFTLGDQQIDATTGTGTEAGVATVQLRLNQRKGRYPLTATWTQTPDDAARWVGASVTLNFQIK